MIKPTRTRARLSLLTIGHLKQRASGRADGRSVHCHELNPLLICSCGEFSMFVEDAAAMMREELLGLNT
jgi:hypothetical protein